MPRHVKNGDPSIPGEPSYRLHKPSGQAVVGLSGQTVYLGRFGTDESAERYRAAVAEWIARGRVPAKPEAAPLSVNELVLSYRNAMVLYYRRPDGTPNKPELWHLRRALRPLWELFGPTPARDFGPRKLEVVRERFIADGLCRSLVNRYTRRIRQVFRWAVQKEMLPAAVWQGLAALEGLRRGHTTARETEPVRPVLDALVDAIRPHVGRQVWAMVELQRFTGMRPGEVCAIRAMDLDLSGPVWLYRPPEHKTSYSGKLRVVALGPKAQDVLRPFLTAPTGAHVFRPIDADTERRAELTRRRKTPPTCGNRPGTNRREKPRKRPGEQWSVDSYRAAIQAGCDKAFPPAVLLARLDVESVRAWRDRLTAEQWTEVRAWQREHHWHPHQLRHSFATRVRREFGLDAAQVALGHSSANVTELYAEKNEALATVVALRIG